MDYMHHIEKKESHLPRYRIPITAVGLFSGAKLTGQAAGGVVIADVRRHVKANFHFPGPFYACKFL